MFLEMNDYLLGARKMLNKYGFSCHRNDDDAISYVASAMIKADNTWDGHSSSRDTWRFNQAWYAISHLKAKHRRQKKVISLSTVIRHNDGKNVCLGDIIEDKKEHKHFDLSPIISIAQETLTPRQFDCVKRYYLEEMTMEDIGKELGITKQAVSLSIEKAINRLREMIRHECPSTINNFIC
jgi:RNA polymerase sigma factor (sigma-70 family)